MTDQQTQQPPDQPIQQAFDRLATALAPPPDLAGRVERRLEARRRVRRAGVAGAACVVAAGVVGGAWLLGSGDRGVDTIAEDVPASATGQFVLTRPDGSTYEMTDLIVSCEGPFGSPIQGASPGPQQIWLTSSPPELTAGGKVLEHPFVMFEGIVEKIDGRTFELPVDGSSDGRPFTLFAIDSEVGPSRPEANEASSAEDGAAGSVVVARASCDGAPVLDLEIDATLGSEVEQGTLHVSGEFR